METIGSDFVPWTGSYPVRVREQTAPTTGPFRVHPAHPLEAVSGSPETSLRFRVSGSRHRKAQTLNSKTHLTFLPGLTVGVMGVPESLSYASIAALPFDPWHDLRDGLGFRV